MSATLKNRLGLLLTAIATFAVSPAFATHLIGDEFTYKYLGDTSIYGTINHKYEVTLNLYEDCLAGEPAAIAQDNPAFFGLYHGTGLVRTDSVSYSTSVPIPILSSSSCGTGGTTLCVLKKTFVHNFYLPVSTTEYTVVYQRCCKNGALSNIIDPLDRGSTYYCTIPGSGTAATNNGAVFTNYPPLVIALNDPLLFDNSATDEDGDSLSYSLCTAYQGASTSNIKPYPPTPPPYYPEDYIPSLSFHNPMTCSAPLTIDSVTGLLSGTPDAIGRYLVAIACYEWRAGTLINTTRREFEFDVVVIPHGTFHPFAGNDTLIYTGDTIQFHASHASTYLWTPGTYLSSTSIQDPVGRYPDPGLFTYILHAVSDSGCVGNDTVTVHVMEYSEFSVPSGFTPNGDGKNDRLLPISIKQSKLVNFKIYNRQLQMMFSTTTPGEGWDGRYKGVMQDMGTYFWELFYEDNYGHLRNIRGSSDLVR